MHTEGQATPPPITCTRLHGEHLGSKVAQACKLLPWQTAQQPSCHPMPERLLPSCIAAALSRHSQAHARPMLCMCAGSGDDACLYVLTEKQTLLFRLKGGLKV